MFLVGLTGGIASGKSTVSNILKELGCIIIDADKIAREVVEPGKPAWKEIVEHFGEDVLQTDGALDRGKLGAIIFSDPEKRRTLNQCTHPFIQRTMLWQAVRSLFMGYSFVILDIPLLLEGSALKRYIKYVVVVYCDEATQLERLMKRNDLSQEDALQRINSQVPLETKRKQADFVIDNNGSVADTRRAVEDLHRRLCGSYAHWTLRLVLLGGVLMIGGAINAAMYSWIM